MEAAFENCGEGTYEQFVSCVEKEIGGLAELHLLESEDVKNAVHEFLDEHFSKKPISALKKGKCVSAVLQYTSPRTTTSNRKEEETGIRNRKKKTPTHPPATKPEAKDTRPVDPLEELTFKGQVIFLVIKAIITLIVFTILHRLFTCMELVIYSFPLPPPSCSTPY